MHVYVNLEYRPAYPQKCPYHRTYMPVMLDTLRIKRVKLGMELNILRSTDAIRFGMQAASMSFLHLWSVRRGLMGSTLRN
jgi:hypothetical protein